MSARDEEDARDELDVMKTIVFGTRRSARARIQSTVVAKLVRFGPN